MPESEGHAGSLRSAMVRLGVSALFYSGGLSVLRARAGESPRRDSAPFSVLIYHRVNPDGDFFFPSLSVAGFEAQMRFLARHFRVRPLTELLARQRAGQPIEPWTVALTFDDGYRDNFLYAHPILREYGLRATVFVPTAYIDTGRLLWNDRLAWAVKHTAKQQLEFTDASGRVRLSLRTAADKRAVFLRLASRLKALPDAEKDALLDRLVAELGWRSRGPFPRMLSWNELRRMAREGWEIGSHTVNHRILTRVPLDAARHEIAASKATIEGEVEQPVTLLAYPNGKAGDFNAAVKALVREAGYEGGLTTLDGLNRWPADPLELRRINPWEEHLPSFATKMKWTHWKAMSPANRA
ncbi:MAG TPA: polysaccharide deacetylase family protein [Candidatus Acidoferrales bacterium]|nr:polysaccharide deacetylase family protein [Candidatus Acidoferrales bacterium]